MGRQLRLISKQGYECTVLNQKTSMSILPGTDPVVQAIKRMHSKLRNGTRVNYKQYTMCFLKEMDGSGVKMLLSNLLWFTGGQLPTSLRKKPRKRLRRKASNDESSADDEHRNQRYRNHVTTQYKKEEAKRQ